MSIFKFFYWALAYTVGIVNLFIQIISYIKTKDRLEKDIVLYLVSFAIIVISVSVMEFNDFYWNSAIIESISGNIAFLGSLLLIYFLPRFAHTAKAVEWVKLAKIINSIFAGIAVILGIGVILDIVNVLDHNIIYYSIMLVLVVSIFYSMLILVFKKAKKLSRLQRRLMKIGGIISLLCIPFFIVLDFYYDWIPFLHPIIPRGYYTLPGFYLILNAVLLYGNLKDSFISPDVESIGKDFIVAYGISSREQEVILELIRGTSYKNIAKKLFISLSTVKSHVSSIYQKTETNNKIELIRVLKRYS